MKWYGWIGEMYLLIVLIGMWVMRGEGKYGKLEKLTILLIIGLWNVREIYKEENEGWKEIIILLSVIYLCMLKGKYREEKVWEEEYVILLGMTILGISIIIGSRDLIWLYLGLELLSISQYIIVSIRKGKKSTEGGLKYLILGGLSSGLYLLGVSWIYKNTGTTEWGEIKSWEREGESLIIGEILIVSGLMFKLGTAPLHNWVPDIYEGGLTISIGWIGTIVKLGILVILISIIYGGRSKGEILIIGGILSIWIGSLGGINQSKMRRLIGYSGISHVGWILLGIGGGTIYGLEASIIYMWIYIVMMIGLFTILSMRVERVYIVEFVGEGRENKVMGLTMLILLLSIGGVPLLGGFYGKMWILMSLIKSKYYIIGIVSILISAIGVYNYLEIIRYVYFEERKGKEYGYKMLKESLKTKRIGLRDGIILGMIIYIIITIMLYPELLTGYVLGKLREILK